MLLWQYKQSSPKGIQTDKQQTLTQHATSVSLSTLPFAPISIHCYFGNRTLDAGSEEQQLQALMCHPFLPQQDSNFFFVFHSAAGIILT